MSSLKVEIEKPNNRGALNTTINDEVLQEFKKSCKMSGVRMNTLIEAFMRQYNEGAFYLKLGRNKTSLNIELDDDK